jgi:Phosphotransferase enzyme family
MDAELKHGLELFLGRVHSDGDRPDTQESGDDLQIDDLRVVEESHAYSEARASQLRSEGFASVREYALLPSASAARWAIPLERPSWTVSGLQIYSPFSTRARLLKRLLVPIARTGWKGWARDRVLLASRKPLPIESLMRDATGESSPVSAFSLGTSGRFRKLTVQVTRPNGELLGYLKLPLTSSANQRVQREAAALEQLGSCAALQSQIPRVLHAGAWAGASILFQSAGPAESAPVKFDRLCREFLDKLWSFKKVNRPGNALVEEVGARWKTVETKLDSQWRSLATATLARASRDLNDVSVECGITHGDFAPWNTRLLHGELYVFDWESASERVPRLWDVFHYHVQVESLLRLRIGTGLEPNGPGSDASLLLLYLLHSACDSLQESSPDASRALQYRRDLIAAQLSR